MGRYTWLTRIPADAAPVERLPSSTESGPRWSPDGKYVAFVSGQSENLDIRVAGVDAGEAPRSLASSEGNEESPRWNADSNQIAYVTDLDGHSDVYVTSLEDGSPVRITSGDSEEFLGTGRPMANGWSSPAGETRNRAASGCGIRLVSTCSSLLGRMTWARCGLPMATP